MHVKISRRSIRTGDPKAGSLPPAACEDGRVPQGRVPQNVLLANFFPMQVKAVFTDTACDFVLPADAQGFSGGQEEFLKKTHQVDAKKVFMIRQVHGDKIVTVKKNDLPQQGPLPEADGAVTDVPGIFLSVRTADCLPVFLYDPKKKCIALAHAGWRSTAKFIAQKALKALEKNYNSRAEDVLAAMGPAIGRCCYQVGEEFEKIFPDAILRRDNSRYLDLSLANRSQLLASGVRPENIFDSVFCTACGQGFFSYRRDKEKAGRHLSLLAVNKQ